MKNRLSIYVSSPDSYADVFSVFYKSYLRYWSNSPYEFILTTNTKSYAGIKCICNNKLGDTWVERTIAALPQIKTKYVLLICDDLIISDFIDNNKIEYILNYMDSNDIRYCRVKPLKHGKKISGQPMFNYVKKNTPYAINLQIGIFRVDMLIELLGNGELSAWDIENLLNQKASTAKNEFFTDIISLDSPLVPYIHGVYKGSWMHAAAKYIRKEYPDYQFERPLVSRQTEFKIKLIDLFSPMFSSKKRFYLKKIFKIIGVSFATET